jgi:hypothetical protein
MSKVDATFVFKGIRPGRRWRNVCLQRSGKEASLADSASTAAAGQLPYISLVYAAIIAAIPSLNATQTTPFIDSTLATLDYLSVSLSDKNDVQSLPS